MPSLRAPEKAQVYNELAKLVQSGFGIDKAADALQDHGAPAFQRDFARALQEGIAAGKTIAEAAADAPLPITDLEISILSAAEKSGRLEDGFAHLANYFEMLDRTRRTIRRRLVYPAVLLHVAVVIPAIPRAVIEGTGLSGMLAASLIPLAIIYVLALAGFLAWRSTAAAARSRPAIDHFLNRVPLVGKVRRSLALARFCRVSEIYLLAGQKPSDALEAAGRASHAGAIDAASKEIAESCRHGLPLGPPMVGHPAFPSALARSIVTAEVSGTLEKEFHRWGILMEANSAEALERFGEWAPKIVYFLAILFAAYQIIALWMTYISGIQSFLPT